MRCWINILSLIFIVFSSFSFSQSIDVEIDTLVNDSIKTKEMYDSLNAEVLLGKDYTKWYTLDEIYRNNNKVYGIDTSIQRFHLEEQNEFGYSMFEFQDLGGIGSPYFSVDERLNTEIVVRSGRSSFNHYANVKRGDRFFNTPGAYSRLHFFQGFNGQQTIIGQFNKNFLPKSGLGVGLDKSATERLIGRNPSGDPFTDNLKLFLNGYYHTPNDRYKVYLNYHFFKHVYYENGGAYSELYDSTQNNIDLFDGFIQPRIIDKSLRIEDRRNDVHFYQDFSLIDSSSILQIFTDYNYQRQIYSFADNSREKNSWIYQEGVYGDTTKFLDSIVFKSHDAKIGLKGSLSSLFYSAYIRDYSYLNTINDSIGGVYLRDSYFGGELSLQLDSNELAGFVKFEKNLQDRYMLFHSRVKLKGFSVGYKRTISPPSFYNNYSFGSNTRWNKDLIGESVNKWEMSYDISTKSICFSPFLLHNQVYNYIFSDGISFENENSTINITQIGFKSDLRWGLFRLTEYCKFLRVDNSVLPIPKVYSFTELAINGFVKKYNFFYDIGVDMKYVNSYAPLVYSPQIQAYSYAGDFRSNAFMTFDAFMNFRLLDFKIFVKMTNLFEGVLSEGYFSSPYYFGKERTFELGINWEFYN